MPLETINPATGELIKAFTEHTPNEVNDIIDLTQKDFEQWRKTDYSHRQELMIKAAAVLEKNKKKYAEILTLEMGKPITQAYAEVDKCIWVCNYYADETENILANEVLASDAGESYVQFDPIGIVLAVMPWNFPFWQVFRFAAPALMAGNAGLLKHASNVPMAAMAIEEVFQEAGFPKNIFRTLMIGSSKVRAVIDNPDVKACTLTGSEIAGQKVAAACGENLKKTVMELGGSDPFIILDDCNLTEAINMGVTSRILNNGQSCIAAKRFIVVEKIYDQFIHMFNSKMGNLIVGDPMNEETELGPMAREDLMEELHQQVLASLDKGAVAEVGGKPLDRAGAFYPATVLTNVTKGMPAYDEEFFGPVAIVIKVKDADEAIKVANDTPFGLGSSLWTNNLELAKKLSKEIDSGSVFINGMVKSDPRLPFGGAKISGYGRELSHYGIKEFVNIKTIWIK